ncbi:putative PEP-binding protein [Devosia sp. MC521]|uniref:putative PEP-binding protein n=1 Tax=Devosia sp. MC521 TaxID=2759954 RepID=UPI0015F83358|nr:putative PEP-binding protein [Devosia sp. MC521]MBJ6988226.1 pyruvate, phosphate dikinase [Devosia sp. MC521]QMW63258.1 pyruvate, phosphate dikinase [Devosia sp. MC521]
MSLAQEMFAIAPALGKANLGAAQLKLLTGKARWIFRVGEAGFPTVPTIAITRAAWDELQAERSRRDSRLRTHWVACLFKLVEKDGKPPVLVVRTSAVLHNGGLMPAKTGIAAPSAPEDSVDPNRPLARAIKEAFESYGPTGRGWTGARSDVDRSRQIVLVQAYAEGEIEQFLTRNAATGVIGPAPVNGHPLPRLPESVAALVSLLDAKAGRHMTCAVAVHKGQVRFLSARPIEASPAAELTAAVDRVERKVWTPQNAVSRVDPSRLGLVLHPRIKLTHDVAPIATGLGVAPGAASGIITFNAEDAARLRARGKHCILVVNETGPADIEGMKAATGILTARGGMSSHAGVIARITGKPCVAGLRTLSVNVAEMVCHIGDREFRAGDRLTIDGTDGKVYVGTLPLAQPQIGGAIGRLLGWSDASRTIAVRTNVETVESAQTALSFGAEGIGLARSEHMFFSPERMVALRRVILSEDEDARSKAIAGLIDYQTGDYSALFSAMHGLPVTVRLFDPPLHEFLPRTDEEIEETAASLGFSVRALRMRLERIAEINPMLGHRGVRLAITYPDLLQMQVQAVLAGARAASETQAEPVQVELMVPFVSTATEVAWVRERTMAILENSGLSRSDRVRFSFGTMLELPRACLRAGDIASMVDFISFGTNDLTQTTFGISRDDAPAFLAAYQRKGVYARDPFVNIDEKGVGEMIQIAIERGRAVNPRLKIGICGEHAGDPISLQFFAGLGVNYVSCSPYRVPIARLALAQTSA